MTSTTPTPRVTRRLLGGLAGALAGALAVLAAALPARADEAGLATRPSPHDVAETVLRFEAAVRALGWVVFTRIDHAAAGQAAGQALRPRTVIFFGNPAGGTAAMRTTPTLALDLPMRVLVWQDDTGATFITRSQGSDVATRVFARHGIAMPEPARQGLENVLDGLVRKAAE